MNGRRERSLVFMNRDSCYRITRPKWEITGAPIFFFNPEKQMLVFFWGTMVPVPPWKQVSVPPTEYMTSALECFVRVSRLISWPSPVLCAAQKSKAAPAWGKAGETSCFTSLYSRNCRLAGCPPPRHNSGCFPQEQPNKQSKKLLFRWIYYLTNHLKPMEMDVPDPSKDFSTLYKKTIVLIHV